MGQLAASARESLMSAVTSVTNWRGHYVKGFSNQWS